MEVLPDPAGRSGYLCEPLGVFPRSGRGGARARERVRRTPRLPELHLPGGGTWQAVPLESVSGGSPVNFSPRPSLDRSHRRAPSNESRRERVVVGTFAVQQFGSRSPLHKVWEAGLS